MNFKVYRTYDETCAYPNAGHPYMVIYNILVESESNYNESRSLCDSGRTTENKRRPMYLHRAGFFRV